MPQDSKDTWQDPLGTRYATAPMRAIFSEQNRIKTWRRVWLALAEAQHELGLTGVITAEALAEMRANLENIDFACARQKEREIRHDVMAHVYAFGQVCPQAAGIIHLGATSEFVCGNTDLMLQRDALTLVLTRLVTVMSQLVHEAETYADLPCLGYTHFQVAQPTTVGKRLTLYLMDFLLDLDRLEDVRTRFVLRGAKGTVGTQATFLSLLGDEEKVKELDRRVAQKLEFSTTFPVTGQTYTRKFDVLVCEVLAGIAGSAHKFAVDLRLLSHLKEVEEPFEQKQTGSSAMVYKRNPMRSERVTALARKLMAIPGVLRETHANQWFERTLDDSALRRLEIPSAFLLTDAILNLLQNITANLTVHHEVIDRRLRQHLPFLATEELLMECVRRGTSRQDCHERLKLHAGTAWEEMVRTGSNDSFRRLVDADPELPITGAEFRELLEKPEGFTGRAPGQTRDFVATVRDRLTPYGNLIGSCEDRVTV